MTPRMYTTKQVCAMLLVSAPTISEMVNAGVLERPLRGKISIRSVDAFLEDGRPWQEIAAEKQRAARKDKAPSGKTRKQNTGAGASRKTAKITTFPTLTDSGLKRNLLPSSTASKKE